MTRQCQSQPSQRHARSSLVSAYDLNMEDRHVRRVDPELRPNDGTPGNIEAGSVFNELDLDHACLRSAA